MAAMKAPPPTISLPKSEIEDQPFPTHDSTTNPDRVEDEERPNSSRNKRPARSPS